MDFKNNVGDVFIDDKRNFVIIDKELRIRNRKPDKKGRFYNAKEKWYKYICNNCGWTEGWIEESVLRKGIGCSCCNNKTVVPGINDIPTTAPWMVKYFQGGYDEAKLYTRSSGKVVEAICPDCGKKKKVSPYRIYKNKTLCCDCNDGISYPEKFVSHVLMQLDINFKRQYSPDYLNNKRSDFYLSDYTLVIETDGGLGHKGGKVHGRSNKSIEECIEIDNWKDEQHKLHGVDTIRINCFESDMEYIKNNILNSKLAELFDLGNVDFVQADLYAIKSNKVKEVCDYWNQKEEWETTVDLAKVFNYDYNTIGRMLKKGARLGWCKYDAKEEVSKTLFKKGATPSNSEVPIVVYKKDNNTLIGTFKSASYFIRYAENKWGIDNISATCISRVCKEKRTHHRGFVFKYAQSMIVSKDRVG